MSAFPRSPRLVKAGIVVIEPETGRVIRIIPFQYNPASLTHTLRAREGEYEARGSRYEGKRQMSPPIESFRIEAELDATDLLEGGDATAGGYGIYPALSALETLIYPTSLQLMNRNHDPASGIPESVPMDAPLTVFVWNSRRIVPVRITEFSITEEAFDPLLNPIRANVSIGMQVLPVDDPGLNHHGESLYLKYLQEKEKMAAEAKPGTLRDLGIAGIL